MKRLVYILISFIICFSFTSCEETKKSSTVAYPLTEINTVYDSSGRLITQVLYNELTNEYITNTYTYQSINGVWHCVDQKTTTVSYSREENSPTISNALNIYYQQDLVNNPIILIDNDDIKISIIEYLDAASWWEFGYKLKVENRSDKTITYLIDCASIMDINCEPLFDVDHIESGHTAYFNMAWDKETLERCHIPYIDNIEFMIRVFDNDDWTSPALYGTRALIKQER